MKIVLVALISITLFACSSGEHEDLRKWMDDASKDVKGKIPSLPEVKPYAAVPYDAEKMVDPFKPSKIEPEKKEGGGGKRPDLNRPKEPLESYPLASLKFVGLLVKNKTSYAIIAAEGSLFQVKPGNYVGQNFGVITNVSEAELSLLEMVQDSADDWIEKRSTLQLQPQEKEMKK